MIGADGKGQDSLAHQEAKCREWADDAGHEVVAVFQDEATSGTLGVAERAGLRLALDALEAGDSDGIVVHRIDRLARELHVQEMVLGHAWGLGDHVEAGLPLDAVDVERAWWLMDVLTDAGMLREVPL